MLKAWTVAHQPHQVCLQETSCLKIPAEHYIYITYCSLLWKIRGFLSLDVFLTKDEARQAYQMC